MIRAALVEIFFCIEITVRPANAIKNQDVIYNLANSANVGKKIIALHTVYHFDELRGRENVEATKKATIKWSY